MSDETPYTGEKCLSGECALCNPEHPDHAKARKEQDHMFGITHHGSDSACPVCNDRHPKHAQAMQQLRALSEGGGALNTGGPAEFVAPAEPQGLATEKSVARADSQGMGGGGVCGGWSAE